MSTQTLPDGVRYRLRGANEESEEAANFLGFAMLASLMLMFIILLMQFNSIYYTFLTFPRLCCQPSVYCWVWWLPARLSA